MFENIGKLLTIHNKYGTVLEVVTMYALSPLQGGMGERRENLNTTVEDKLTVKQMREQLGYKNDISVLRLIRNGEISASFIKNRYTVENSEFDRFLESRKGAKANDVRQKRKN